MTKIFEQEEADELLKKIEASDAEWHRLMETRSEEMKVIREKRNDLWEKLVNSGYLDRSVNEDYEHDEERFKIYDFLRPDFVSKNQMLALQMISGDFGTNASMMLSGLLRKTVNIELCIIDQIRYDEYIRSIPERTFICEIAMNPLPGSIAIEIDPVVGFAITDILSGIKKKNKMKARIPGTDEVKRIKPVFQKLSGILKKEWSGIVELQPRVKGIESETGSINIVPFNNMIMLSTFSMQIDDHESMMNLCIPYSTIQPVMKKLDSFYKPGIFRIEEPVNDEKVKTGKIKNLTLCAVIDRRDMTSAYIDELTDGSLIEFSKGYNETLDLYIEEYDLLIAKSEAGVKDGLTAVRIEKKLIRPSGLTSISLNPGSMNTRNKNQCRFIYGKTKVSLSDIKKMKEGDVVVLDDPIGKYFKLEAGNELYEAQALVNEGRFMARINIDREKFVNYKNNKSTVSVDRLKRIIRVTDETALAGIEEYIKKSGYTVEDL